MKKQKQIENTMTEEKLNELKSISLDILSHCRQVMLNRHPFAGTVAMNLDIKPIRDFRCNTAMTDGKNIFFDIDFLGNLTDAEREFVLGHEVWHVIMMHFLRGEGKDHNLFNIASDMEVNQLLEADGFIPPTDVLFPNKHHSKKSEFDFPDGLSAEEYYELLEKEVKKHKNKNDGDGEGKQGSKNGKKSKNGQGGLSGQFDKHYDKNENYDKEIMEEISDRYGVKGIDKDFTPASIRNESEERAAIEKVRESVISSAQQIERTCGSLPGHIKKIVDKLLEPKLPWKELLAAFVTSSFYNKINWNAPNRRFAYTGTYLPSHAGEMMKIAIGIDTSGSCANDCEKFLTEVVSIAKTFGNYELHVIQCDTEVKDYTMFDEGNPLDPENNGIEFKGFGGTILHPIFDYISLNELDVDAVVVFTDGECEEFTENDNIELPVLWCLVGNKEDHQNLQVGQQIHIIE